MYSHQSNYWHFIVNNAACLAPKTYRENCDCHRYCEDIDTDCNATAIVSSAQCDYGCFCPEGQVLESESSTECILKEYCNICVHKGDEYEVFQVLI